MHAIKPPTTTQARVTDTLTYEARGSLNGVAL